MRKILVALVIAFADPAAAQDLRVLTDAEVRQGFEGRQGCRSPTTEGECEAVLTVVSSDAPFAVREVGLTSIVDLGAEPLSELVRGLAFYQQHADLFTELEAQRSAGGFLYLKQIETASAEYDAAAGAYCTQVDTSESLAGVEFYFSSSLKASVEGDTPFSPEHAARFRAFIAALARDPEFRAALPETDGIMTLLDVVTGDARYCVAYVGVVTERGVDVRGSLATANGRPMLGLNQPIRMAPLTEQLRLVPD